MFQLIIREIANTKAINKFWIVGKRWILLYEYQL